MTFSLFLLIKRIINLTLLQRQINKQINNNLMIQMLVEMQKPIGSGNDVLELLNKYKQQLNINISSSSNNNNINSSKPISSQLTELLIRERIVYLTATAINLLSQSITTNSQSSLLSQLVLNSQLTTFINKVNFKVMSTHSEQINFQQKLYLISKSIDMLYYHVIVKNVKPLQQLLQLRALTFNNLSCLYKENKQYEDALKSLQVALQIQQTLIGKNHSQTYKSIASTYINKAVILSSLKLHKQAIETIKIAVDRIEKYRERLVNEKNEVKEKEQHEVKRINLLTYFNIAVQYQHLGNNQFAVKFYQIAFKLAKQLSNKDVISQSLSALKKLKLKN